MRAYNALRVGIDARLLSENSSGIGRYTAELTKELVRRKNADFFLYSPTSIDQDVWEQEHVFIRAANFESHFGKQFWYQSYLPYWIAVDRLDVFWGTAHRLPLLLPANISRVVTVHDLVWKHAGDTMRPLGRFLDQFFMPKAVAKADRVLVDSQSTYNDIKNEFPLTASRLTVVSPGVSKFPPALEPETLIHHGITSPYILFVGTSEPRKNLARLIQAFATLEEARSGQYQLVISGGKGWGNLDIDALIQMQGLEGKVITTGYVNDAMLATLYSNALFLVLPSLYEGFGLPLIEAMSFGLAVLASNTSSLPEVVGEAGVFVDPNDELSIAAGLRLLLNNPQLRKELASHAAAQSQRYTWQNAANKLWEVLEETNENKNT